MGRSDRDYIEILGTKGINQQDHLSDSVMELEDARNLWAPNGKLEQRPGFWGVGSVTAGPTTAALTGSTTLSENVAGTYVVTGTFDSKATETWWYMGWTGTIAESKYPDGVRITVATSNSNEMSSQVEYWNGLNWVLLDTVETTSDTFVVQDHLAMTSGVGAAFWFPWPRDWAQTTLDTTTGYFLRITLKSKNGSSAFDASTSVTSNSIVGFEHLVNTTPQRFFVVAQFPNCVRFLRARTTGSGTTYVNASGLSGPIVTTEIRANTTITAYLEDVPASVAIVPDFGEFYVAYNYQVTNHKSRTLATTDAASAATVETDKNIIGTGAPYDPAFRPFLGIWPQAKYIYYHRGEMWAANLLDGGQNSVRWSAGSPNYRVWPVISIDSLADKDSSPITALFPMDQDMLAFKSDSIWRMVYTGINEQQLNSYRGEKIVSGVGCVAHNSIQDIRGQLVFLAEDGVYLFDGVKTTKLSDRIQKTIDSLVPGRKAFASSLNWREKSLYLLSVTSAGSDINDTILVWDYKNNSWWIWDNIEAVDLFSVKASSVAEKVYFSDRHGRIFQLGVGNTDYGTAITSYYVSQRLNQEDLAQKIRSVTLLSTNLSGKATVEATSNDGPFLGLETTEVDFTDVNDNEKQYGVAVYNASQFVEERERYRGTGELRSGEWFRVKISHSEKGKPFTLIKTKIGIVPTGVRR